MLRALVLLSVESIRIGVYEWYAHLSYCSEAPLFWFSVPCGGAVPDPPLGGFGGFEFGPETGLYPRSSAGIGW